MTSELERAITEDGFDSRQNVDRGGSLEVDGGAERSLQSLQTAGAGDGGREGFLPPPELEGVPARRDGRRNSGSVPPRGPASGWISGGVPEVEAPGGGPVPSGSPASGEMIWAEQADRAFRRDSRRYDGGFYLY